MTVYRHAAGTLLLALAIARPAEAADPAKQVQVLQGSWLLQSLDQGGGVLDAKRVAGHSMLIGGRSVYMRQGSAITQVCLLHVNAAEDRQVVNLTVVQGTDAGAVQLGIYTLRGDTLTLCLDGDGIDRPDEFRTQAGSKRSLAVYKRRVPPGGGQDLSGFYRVENQDDAGNTVRGEAIIERQGDSYTVIYKHGGGVAFVGIGIRTGDTFSVSWRNQLQSGISVYQIAPNRRLTGKYTMLGGNGAQRGESLSPDEV